MDSALPNYVNKKFTPKQDPNFVWGNPVRGTNLVIGTDMAAAGYHKHEDETIVRSSTPSDDLLSKRLQYVDSTQPYTTDMQLTFQSGAMVDDAARASRNHLKEFSQCETLGACSAPELKMGSPCSSEGRLGFCYESAAGTLECGRTIATISHFDTPIATPMPTNPGAKIVPCPRHTPTEKGSPTGMIITAVRLPFVGCLIPGDSKFEPHATLHVPSACTTPADYMPGCPLAGALNFVPGAKQVTTCMWPTGGCTDSTSANFDPAATNDDGSCIEKIPGCPIAEFSYAEVAATTPGFKSLYHDDKASIKDAAGRYRVAMPEHKNVVFGAEDPKNANWFVEGSCTVAIEGCTDSTAANYDPVATINSKTWCVPKVEGCMDPNALNFDKVATVHVKDMCEWRRACPSSTQGNAELTQPKASSLNTAVPKFPQQLCWDTAISGCLDVYARNYGCEAFGQAPCVVDEMAFAGPQGDDYTKWAISWSSQGVVTPEPAICYYGGSKKAIVTTNLKELLDLNPDVDENVEITWQYSMTVPPCQVTDVMKASIKKAFSDKYGVDVSLIKVEVVNDDACGRRRLSTGAEEAVIRVRMETTSKAQAEQISGTLELTPLTVATIFAMLKDEPGFSDIPDFAVTGKVQLTYAFVGTYKDPDPSPPPPPPSAPPSAPSTKSSDNTGAIVGGVIGGVILLILCAGGGYYFMKKRQTKTAGVYPA